MRWSLRTRLFVLVSAGAAALALSLSLLVDRTVTTQVERGEIENLEHTRAAFRALQENARVQLLRQSLLVSDLPYFKAATAVYDPTRPPVEQEEALATIAEVAERLLLRVDADLLAVTDIDGNPLVTVGRAVPGGARPDLVTGLARRALGGQPSEAVLETGHGLVQTVAVPMRIGRRTSGTLCLGRSLDQAVADDLEAMTGSGVALLVEDQVLVRGRSVPLAAARALMERPGAGTEGPEPIASAAGTFRVSRTALPVPEGGRAIWFVVLRSEEQALAFVSAVRQGLALLTVAAVLAGLLFSYVFARRITDPVRELVRQTEDLAAGRLEARVETTGRDELGVLGAAFNRMAASLEESRTRLESAHRDLLQSHEETERVNRDLRETHAQLLQAGKMAAFGELGASIAHELRQPLAAIRGFAQLIQMKLPPEQETAHRNLAMIVESTDHMTAVVQGLKDFARRSSDDRKPVDLGEVLRRTAAFLEAGLRSHGIRLVFEVEATAPLVTGDANQLQQVFTNLVTNARDAIGREGAITVRCRADGSGEGVLVEVSDTGPGIPENVLPRMFQSFFTTKPEGQGTGLGLSITQSIVQDHGGTIEATNGPGGGALFRLFLPAAGSAPAGRAAA